MEKYEFVAPIGNHLLFCFFLKKSEKTQHFTQRPGDKHRREQTRAKACVVVRAAAAFFLRRRLGSYHCQRLLRGRREP